jgi:hypothetical protein
MTTEKRYEVPGTPSVSIWPEERLRDELEATGGEATREVTALLAEFGAENPTVEARRNIARQLSGVGVVVDPPLAAADPASHIMLRLRRRDGP